MEKLRKAIFLDRDDVINKWGKGTTGTDADYYILGWDQFEFLPHVMEAFFELYCMDYEVFVVSNQSGVSKKLKYRGEQVTNQSIALIFYEMDKVITDSVRTALRCIDSALPEPAYEGAGRAFMYDVPRVIRQSMFCEHLPEHNCACRKPKPGMIYALATKWGIDLSESWMIGDQDSDINAGWNARMRRLVKIEAGADPYKQGAYNGWASKRTKSTVPVLPSLLNAVQFIQDVDKWEER